MAEAAVQQANRELELVSPDEYLRIEAAELVDRGAGDQRRGAPE